ncbi:LINE-1 retrotransposable element ORF2 protein [Varanus komodoensis]|nr:LINE-1 retrotransposable element ORF2 protein [Varanus komodoensis]
MYFINHPGVNSYHQHTGGTCDKGSLHPEGDTGTEAEEIKKKWQDYTEELYKKELNFPDNHDGVVTDLEPDILECEVKWALGSLSNNKASGGDNIPAELFKILKDDTVKVLHSICQQIWKTQQWPQDWKRSVYIPIPKKGNAKECSDYHTNALISHASKVMLKILQARLQQYVDQELPEVQAGFQRARGTRDQIANIHCIMEKAREFQKNICFIDYAKAFDCVDHNKLRAPRGTFTLRVTVLSFERTGKCRAGRAAGAPQRLAVWMQPARPKSPGWGR